MKSYKRINSFAWLGLIPMLITSLILIGCGSNYNEPVGRGSRFFDILIENQTGQILTIYDEDYEVDNVEPGGQIIMKNQSMNRGRYTIIAKNAQGETVFSEIYTFMPDDKYHLQKAEGGVYKAVIQPLQNN